MTSLTFNRLYTYIIVLIARTAVSSICQTLKLSQEQQGSPVLIIIMRLPNSHHVRTSPVMQCCYMHVSGNSADLSCKQAFAFTCSLSPSSSPRPPSWISTPEAPAVPARTYSSNGQSWLAGHTTSSARQSSPTLPTVRARLQTFPSSHSLRPRQTPHL